MNGDSTPTRGDTTPTLAPINGDTTLETTRSSMSDEGRPALSNGGSDDGDDDVTMINGEGTCETSSMVASPDLSPVSSQYSSCGESEFERYCSANSVMGTPSMGSSSSFRAFNYSIDSEFGSVRNLGIGDDGNLENFSLDGGLDRNFETQKPSSSSGGGGSFGDRRIHYWEGNINSEHRNDMDAGKGLVMVKNRSNLYNNKEDFSMLEGSDAASSDLNMSGLLGYGNLSTVLDEGLSGSDDQDGVILNRGHSETDVMLSSAEDLPSQGSLNAENGSGNMCNSGIGNSSNCWMENEEGSQSRMVIEEVGVCSNGLNSGSDLQFDGRETGKLSEQEESLSRYEHSDDEDSMYEYGTDNEHMTDSHSKQNIQYSREVKNEGGNSLLMNSSIAFGSQDWDDFEQEIVSTNLPSVMSNKVEVRKQLDNESERNLQKFTPETSIEFPGVGGSKQGEDFNQKSIVIGGVQVADESEDYLESSSVTRSGCLDLGEPEQGEEVGNIYLASNPVRGTNESAEYQRCSVSNVYRTQLDSQVQSDPLLIGLNVMGGGIETENQHRIREEVIGLDDNQILESQESGKSNSKLDPLSDTTANQLFFPSTEEPIDEEETFFKELKPTSLAVMFENKTKRISHDSSSFSADLCEDHSASIKHSPRLAGTVNWGTATVVGLFAGMLYGGSKEASASVSKDAEVMLKLGSTADKREQHRLMRDAMEKRFIRVTRGSIVGGVRLGMFTATFFGVQNLLAEKRGVQDVFNIAGAGSVTAATFGLIMPGSLRWRARNVVLGSVLGAAISFPVGWVHLKLVKKANERNSDAYADLNQGEAKSGVGAAIERLEGNLKK